MLIKKTEGVINKKVYFLKSAIYKKYFALFCTLLQFSDLPKINVLLSQCQSMDNITFNLIQENTETGEKLILISDITFGEGVRKEGSARGQELRVSKVPIFTLWRIALRPTNAL